MTARLIVRRIRRLDPPGQARELVPSLALPRRVHRQPVRHAGQAEAQHRDHAIIEQVNAELIDGPLAHLPSGRFAANDAWLTCAAIAHNLTHAAATLASRSHATARPATIRRSSSPSRPASRTTPATDPPAPARTLALARRLGRPIPGHPPSRPPGTTGPRGLSGPDTANTTRGPRGPTHPQPSRSKPRTSRRIVSGRSTTPNTKRNDHDFEDDHTGFVGGSGLSRVEIAAPVT